MKQFARTLPALSLLGATILSTDPVYASGFALNEMSASSVGNALAGGAAAAEDIGTIYYNPAGLMRLPGQQFMIAGSAIGLKAEFENRGSFTAVPPGARLTGGNGGDAGGWALVPALYYAKDLTPNMRFGLGIQTPFGLKTDYEANWVGRYQALKSELKSVNINPTLAYRLNDFVSLGAGISAQYVNVELSRAIDFGSICVLRAGASTCGSIGYAPQTRDGKATVKGNDWGFGYNLGAMFTPSQNMRFGIAYRSKISHELTGNATYDKPANLPAAIATSPTFTNTGARASLDLPESLNLAGYVDLDAKWSVMADVNWTHWSRFKELRVRFDNGAPDSVTAEEWRNTYRVGVGATYRYSDTWKLRTGIAYDQTPVRSEFRTPRVPDADRTWLAFGAQYKLSPQSTIDFAYAHLFVKDASINKSEPPVGGTLIGKYDSNVNIVSVQYNQAF